jgi:DNA oxidative demethylase
MTRDLFDAMSTDPPFEVMAEGAMLLRRRALPYEHDLLTALRTVTTRAPFRHMITPGGFTMSVAMTNCGSVGWVTDLTGYRYTPTDPQSGEPWPALPDCLRRLAGEAAAEAGYAAFEPDVCLINRYEPGNRLSLHQDKDERDYSSPIVSVSLGLPATFQFGGLTRSSPIRKFALRHADVAVWGGPSRLRYHGVAKLADGEHEVLGRARINFTLRRAL